MFLILQWIFPHNYDIIFAKSVFEEFNRAPYMQQFLYSII